MLDPACHRGEPTPWAAFTYFTKLERLFPRSKTFAQYHQGYKSLESIHTIDDCTGAAMLVRTSALSQVGFLDERFFMYAEDVDWCKRFRETGYDVVFHPGAKVRHHKYKSGMGTSDSTIKSNTTNWFYDTMLHYYDKHYGNSYPSMLRSILKFFITIKKRKTA
jgi:GT2 family glycosyltransferase